MDYNKAMKKKKDEGDDLSKLMKLTKLMKMENVKVAPKGPAKARNKWRSYDPKFAPKPEKEEKKEGLVEAGGMMVDPSLKEEYEAWRKDKEAEQQERRLQRERREKAEQERRAAEKPPEY